MSEPNHAGSIIISLASLPDFLRKPILKRRMSEFFSMIQSEKDEVISNALEAGPTIPFANFARLFGTWLEIMATLSENERALLFSGYIEHVCKSPEKLVKFHLDGMFETYLALQNDQKAVIAGTISRIIGNLDAESRRRIFLMIPKSIKTLFCP